MLVTKSLEPQGNSEPVTTQQPHVPESEAPPKRPHGAQRGNSNARAHGLTTLRRALKELGNRAISGRTRAGRALAAWKADIVADLGGDPTTTQRALIELAGKQKLLIDSLDAWLFEQESLVNKSKRQLHNVVLQRQTLVDGLRRCLRDLGFQRRARRVATLDDYLETSRDDDDDATADAT